MKKVFTIEDTVVSYNSIDIKKNDFTVQSLPFNYSVKFINDKQLKKIISSSGKNNKSKHFVFVDAKVDNYYNKLLWEKEYIIPFFANEANKTIHSSLILIDLLNENNFTKKENLISIGGGITQDVTAFACAVFKRGISWTFVPTTLLAMTDSCIGAKSAINYRGTKNLLGLFTAPKLVYINLSFLSSLSKRDILSGYGEIIKLCIVGGEYTFQQFNKIKISQKGDLLFNIDVLIKMALMVKKSVIIKDEFENNIRKALNYGHTIAHAIEPIVKYKIPHGIAVLIGMYVENIISCKYGYLDTASCDMLNEIITSYIDSKSLTLLKKMPLSELMINIEKDKKNESKLISFAVPFELGCFKLIRLKNDKKLAISIENAFYKLLM